MEFKKLKEIQQKHVAKMLEDQDHLFVVDVDKDDLWNLYLDSFPEGTNPIFRERREFDCSCCRQFIKNFGNVVVIRDNKLVTIWDFNINSDTYQPVINALSKFVKSANIANVFITKEKHFGTDFSREQLENGDVYTWHHFRINIPKQFISQSSKSTESEMSIFRSTKEVFARSLEEISQDSVETVLELIGQNSLYKGEEWKAVLQQFLTLQKEYYKLPVKEKDNYVWSTSLKVGAVVGKIRNHSIGVLLSDITANMDLDIAVKRYEKIVAPTNYKRPKAIFTKKMIEHAQHTIEGLGMLESLGRRHASIDDITVNNILFANRDSMKKITGNVFDELKTEIKVNTKSFDKLEKIHIEDFIKNVIPNINDMKILFKNSHKNNLVSLIAPQKAGSKSMFKWDNNFSWAYNGNITDSMKERVKAAGGRVDGVLRFSIQWNEDGKNDNDYDAHCREPNGNVIYFRERVNCKTGGNLDVDIRQPKYDIDNGVAVENITWPLLKNMQDGVYIFSVHNYAHRGGRDGFLAEIEFNGETHSFEYRKDLPHGHAVEIARVELKNGVFKIIKSIPSTTCSKKIWNIDTEQFHPVSVCMYSPNYWNEQAGIGNKHYLFILNNCKNDSQPNGFFNEFLREDLMEHKRVFEALGGKMSVENTDKQLSGLGFSSTQRNSLICKVNGKFSRMLEINF